jgi:hypothetical protein
MRIIPVALITLICALSVLFSACYSTRTTAQYKKPDVRFMTDWKVDDKYKKTPVEKLPLSHKTLLNTYYQKKDPVTGKWYEATRNDDGTYEYTDKAERHRLNDLHYIKVVEELNGPGDGGSDNDHGGGGSQGGGGGGGHH